MVQQVLCLSQVCGTNDLRAQNDCIPPHPCQCACSWSWVAGFFFWFPPPVKKDKTAIKQSRSLSVGLTTTRLDLTNAKPPNPSYCVRTDTIPAPPPPSFSRNQPLGLRLGIRKFSKIDLSCSRFSDLAEIKEHASSPSASRAAAR